MCLVECEFWGFVVWKFVLFGFGWSGFVVVVWLWLRFGEFGMIGVEGCVDYYDECNFFIRSWYFEGYFL